MAISISKAAGEGYYRPGADEKTYYQADVGARGVIVCRITGDRVDSRWNDRVGEAAVWDAARGLAYDGSMMPGVNPDKPQAKDVTLSAPKSVSVAWAAAVASGDEGMRTAIEQAQQAAVESALRDAIREGWIYGRAGKNGKTQVAAEEMRVAVYQHGISREGDPQLHSHVIIPSCVFAGGRWRRMEMRGLYDHQKAIDALYLSALARELRARGIEVEADRHTFRVTAVPKGLEDPFSKRQRVIEGAGGGGGGAALREEIALATRGRKRDETLEQAAGRWADEARAAGHPMEMMAMRLEAQMVRGEAEGLAAKAPPPERPASARLREMHVVTRDAALIAIAEEVGWRGEDVREVLAREVAEGRVREIVGRDGERYYATGEALEREERVVSVLRESRGAWAAAPTEEVIEAAIRRREGLSEEQAEAVRHALSRDGISVIEGAAGSGKSYSLGAVADAARDAGLQVHVIAPSHKAREVARHDTETSEDMSAAVQGFTRRLTDPEHPRAVRLGAQDVVIIDEAGMVGMRDMDVLLVAARRAGAKVILAGDTRQLPPVEAGAPMRLAAEVLGTQRISQIRRQREEWQREASEAASRHDLAAALGAYAARGRVEVAEDQQAAMRAIAVSYATDIAAGRLRDPREGLIVAATNRQARALGEAARAAWQAAGVVGRDEIEAEARVRGQGGGRETLRIAVGDRILAGEQVTVGGETVYRSETGTVRGITDGQIEIEWDSGKRTAGTLSEYIAETARREGETAPAWQYAYATTVHASQGQTVERAYVLWSGQGAESTYVAITRHRGDCMIAIDAARVGVERGDRDDTAWREEVIAAAGQRASRADGRLHLRDIQTDTKTFEHEETARRETRRERDAAPRADVSPPLEAKTATGWGGGER